MRKYLFRRKRRNQELEEEIQAHLTMATRDRIERGEQPQAAELAARREFGNRALIQETTRQMWGWSSLEALWQDARYALRGMRRSPGFTAVAVLSLALGIGANTAIFSLVRESVLKPPPFRDPGRLAVIWDNYLPQFSKLGVSPTEWQALERESEVFEQIAWYRYVPQNLILAGEEPLEIHASFVSDKLLSTFGSAPMLGRGFGGAESPASALISYRLWQTRFTGNRAVVGKTVRLDNQEFTIVGVMPAGFQFPDWADIWLPAGPLLGDQLVNPVRHALGMVGRLRAGMTIASARMRVKAIMQQLALEHPQTSTNFGMQIFTLQDDLSAAIRSTLLLLWGAVSLVLLIACANVGNLLLGRAAARAKEMAMRRALGAGIWRLLRQLMIESLLLATMGAAVGLLLARWSGAYSPMQATLDFPVLGFSAGISIVAAILFGLAPAVHLLRDGPASVIKSSTVGGGLRGGLVIAEFALAVIVVAGAGILAKSFLRMMRADPGFQPHGVLTVRFSFPPSQKPDALFHRIEENVRRLPGVTSVAATNALPLLADRANTTRFNVPGSPGINPDALPAAQIHTASPNYFRAMGIPLRSGRPFTDRDMGEPVVIVNETMAQRFWPDRDPIGVKFITGPWGPSPSWSTIIGVVADVKEFGLDAEPSQDLYFPAFYPTYVIVKTAGDVNSLIRPISRAIHAAAPELPISDIQTLDQVMARSAHSRLWTLQLVDGFAILALVLALVGIYGVVSWSVSQRTREIGIRLALGANSGRLRRLVLRRGLYLSISGTAIGMVVAFLMRRVLAAFLFEVDPSDPAIYGATAVLMIAIAELACYLPARRASQVDPSIALRHEA